MPMPFTDHARARMQQRGIRPEALETLLDRGRVHPLHSEGTVGHRYCRLKGA